MRNLLLVLILFSGSAVAHKFDSAFVSVTERSAHRYSLQLKLPLTAGRATAPLDLVLPEGCAEYGQARSQRDNREWLRNWEVRCEQQLVDRSVRLLGLNATVPNAVVALRFAGGAERVLLIDQQSDTFIFSPGEARQSIAAAAYFPLGIEHILFGPDHLLFVTGLLLVVLRAGAGTRTLVGTVTAFTVAHSITLALAALGRVSLPSTPVEAVIALSILLLAVELSVARGSSETPATLTFRKPWLVAFGFGLIHGFGFAGALREIGLPEHALGWSLFLFNVGVEVGQLLFVALLLAAGLLLQRTHRALIAPVQQFCTLAMGMLAAFWVIERTFPAISGS